MIIIYHQDNKVSSIWNTFENEPIEVPHAFIATCIVVIAEKFPAELIIWCHSSQKDNINFENISAIFHHKKIMASYNPSTINYLPDSIGYVEESPFIKINKQVQYPTWQMSGCIGGINAQVLNLLHISCRNVDFEYFLSSIAKIGMPIGLFCYSDPNLLIDPKSKFVTPRATIFNLFRFVKEHFKAKWCLLLFIDLLIYGKKFPLIPLLWSCIYKNKLFVTASLDNVVVESSRKVVEDGTIDVIIPTIGRKKYLHDVLKDLANQTLLPKNVIIVEQNPLPNSATELDYLVDENWPFKIKHVFTHQAGACNARNIALSEVESEILFFADDDIKIKYKLLEDTISILKKYGLEAVMLNCLQLGQTSDYNKISQTTIFGSGCSFVKNKSINTIKFDEKLEFGYGEDLEFGMQIRNLGVDIIYLPQPQILHLKAPIGGFRIKHPAKWDNEILIPKPYPTVMYVKLKNLTSQQLLGYKLILFLKLYKFNLFALSNYNKKWERSIYWAKYLMNND